MSVEIQAGATIESLRPAPALPRRHDLSASWISQYAVSADGSASMFSKAAARPPDALHVVTQWQQNQTMKSEIAHIIPPRYPLVWGFSTSGPTVYWDFRLSTTGSPHG